MPTNQKLEDAYIQRRILVIGDLYKRGFLKSFDMLKAQFQLPHSQFWKYLQLRHLLLQTFGSATTPHTTVNHLTFIKKNLGGGCEPSKYYSLLLKHTDRGLPGLRTAWEKDLAVSFTNQERSAILLNTKKVSKELRTRLSQFNLLHRIYWTPLRLHRAKLVQTPECWRCQQDVGTLNHTILSCSKIRRFWLDIKKFIDSVVQHDNPLLVILGDPASLKHLPPNATEWVLTALILGRKVIIMQWKSSSFPTFIQWFNHLGRLASFEHLLYKLHNRLDRF